MIETAPRAWQTIDEQDIAVAVRYLVAPDGRVGFALGAYDPSHPLTIDPTLIYSTFLGGSGDDIGGAIAVDSGESVYVAGQPGFVTKLHPSGSSVIYTTWVQWRMTPVNMAATSDDEQVLSWE